MRACGADADQVLREVVCRNVRAARTLLNARARTPWLAVSLEGFGRHKLAPAKGLLTIGDAASFIDPFTGSGMLMAFESGELVAQVIAGHLGVMKSSQEFIVLAAKYREAYSQRFDSRLRLCSMMRRAAFFPGLAELAIRSFRLSDHLRRRVTQGTRSGGSQRSESPLVSAK